MNKIKLLSVFALFLLIGVIPVQTEAVVNLSECKVCNKTIANKRICNRCKSE